MLKLIERLPRNDSFSGNNRYRALVECECGFQYETGFYAYKKAKSCKDCFYTAKNKTVVSQSMISRCRKDAARRGIDFDLNLKDLAAQFNSQVLEGESFARCFYSGRPLHMRSSSDHNVSIDRYNSSLPYTPENIVLATKEVNVAKHTMTESRMLFLVHQMTTPVITAKASPPDTGKKSKFSKSLYSGDRFAGVKQRALKRGLEFSLTVEDLIELYDFQMGTCYYSRLALFPENASIDRIDNDAGYERSNIRLVLKELNFMRHAMTTDEFRILVDDIYEWNFINKKQKGLI